MGVRVQSAFNTPAYKQHLKLGSFGARTNEETKLAPIKADITEDEILSKRIESLRRDMFQKFTENGDHPLHYYRFLMDPTSFEKSVRNIFHMSCLVNNHEAVIVFDDNSQPHVYPKRLEKSLKNKAGSSLCVDEPRNQVGNWIVSLTKNDWKQAIDTYKIEKPMISS